MLFWFKNLELFGEKTIKKVEKERNGFVGFYVAIDNKDRIISFNKDKSKVAEEAMNFGFWNKEYGFKIFKTYNDWTRGCIMGLINNQ